MDPTEKGWLAKYLELRARSEVPAPPLDADTDVLIYKLLQPTGLLYGHPLSLPSYLSLNTDEWPVLERIKLIYAEGLLLLWQLYRDPGSIEKEGLAALAAFFSRLYPRSGLMKALAPKDILRTLEQDINRRAAMRLKWNKGFWQGFFQNVLLFADIASWKQLLLTDKAEELNDYHTMLVNDILSLIAGAASADGSINQSEEKLFASFVEASGLKGKQRKEALSLLYSGSSANESLKGSYSWLEAKYLLDLGALVVWADRKLEHDEERFLERLSRQLGLKDEDLHASLAGVEGFVIGHWEQVHYLQSKQNYLVVSRMLIKRLSAITGKYKEEIKQEIAQSKELVTLIERSGKRPLTTEEKEKVRAQLIDIIKLIPTFVYLTLPFTFFTLPLLFKVIPKEAFPSSFDPNRLTQRQSSRGGKKKYLISE